MLDKLLTCTAFLGSAMGLAAPAFSQRVLYDAMEVPAGAELVGVDRVTIESPPRVSEAHVRIGGWRFRPIHDVAENGSRRVIAVVSYADHEILNGNNIAGALHTRPIDGDCGEWDSIGFVLDPEGAARHAEQTLGVPVSDRSRYAFGANVEMLVAEAPPSEPLEGAVFAGDPLAEAFNGAAPDQAELVVENLWHTGEAVYFVAGLPATDLDEALHAMAGFFDATLGRAQSDEVYEAALDQFFGIVARPCTEGVGQNCWATVVYGDWFPEGELCDCRTDSTTMFCGTFTVQANGKACIGIPKIPLGQLCIEGEVGAVIDLCLCRWRRTCIGPGKRRVTVTRTDCTRSTHYERRDRMVFVHEDYDIAFDAAGCATNRPPSVPPDDEPCGLRYEVANQ